MKPSELIEKYAQGVRDFSGANLRGANLRGANLREADLYEADLSGADLRGADLRGANLRGANLSAANLSAADLYEADLSGVKGLSTKEQELQILQFIKEEIVSQSLLDMSHWHTNWEWGYSLCGTTHCAAGSAQVWASLKGLTDYKDVDPWIAGSMLIPSVAHLFYSRNEEFVEYLDGILAGEIPLLDR